MSAEIETKDRTILVSQTPLRLSKNVMANAASSVRLLIVNPHLLVCDGLRMVLDNAPGLKVVGVANNRADALKEAKSKSPDIVLLDLDSGGEIALSFLPELREEAEKSRVLVITSVKDPEVHRQAVRLGAMGVVLKQYAADVLIKAIRKVHAGEIWLDRSAMGSLLREMAHQESNDTDSDESRIRNLTAREFQVIALISEGLKNRQIAERLFISETTVTHHLSSIFSKLRVSDRLELVIYAFGHHLTKMRINKDEYK